MAQKEKGTQNLESSINLKGSSCGKKKGYVCLLRFWVVFWGCFPMIVVGLKGMGGGFAVGVVLGFCGSLFPFNFLPW